MNELTADLLIDSCRDDSLDAGLTITTALTPLGGHGAPVKPPIYAPATRGEGPQYQFVMHWRDPEADAPVEGILIDNVPSQANRAEAELEQLVDALGLPEIALDLTSLEPLPAHAPRRISSYRFPHRVADSYLRDSLIGGQLMGRTPVGRALFAATALEPLALLQWFPHALGMGFWQSHLGKGRSQAKLARSWTSQIVGYQPAVLHDGDAPVTPRIRGLKGDPLNLSSDEPVVRDPGDEANWDLGTAKAGPATDRTKLSEIGHGQVPFSGNDTAPAAVSFRSIEQRATLSTSGLRRIWVDTPDRNALARAVVAAVLLVGHTAAHARPFSLRSGTDLRPEAVDWTWLAADGQLQITPLSPDDATTLLQDVVAQAADAELPVGSGHWSQLMATPSAPLAKAIRSTYPAPVVD